MNKSILFKLTTAAALSLGVVLPASAVTYMFSADLSGATEAPPNSSPGFGTALVTFDDAALTVSVLELWGNLTGPVTANHIHCCTATPGTGTAPVTLGFTGVPAVNTGFYSNTFSLAAGAFSTLLVGTQAGSSYVNIHTANNPGGEIRGFLLASAVPEPATFGLMALGLALVGGLARRRKAA
ncbi:MAG: CHRD domain-containing protein [Pseudomonadota bacterium]|nr:CHRD domain-containing protein [Pseudomonadota bacterium]